MTKISHETVIEAFQRAAQDYGIKKLAGEMDKAPSTLYAELNPWGDRSKSKLGFEDAMRIAVLTGDICGFELALDALGYAVQPKTAVPNRETAVEELAEDTIDFGKFAQVVNKPNVDQEELISVRDNLIENLHQTVAAKEKELREKQNADLR